MTDYQGNVINLMTKAQYDSATKSDNELYAVRTETIIETYVNGTSGYRIWSDGYCEQWGRYTIATNGIGTISFIKTFANTNYSVFSCKVSPDRSTWSVMFASIALATSIQIQSNLTGYTLKGSWLACGYLAEGEY